MISNKKLKRLLSNWTSDVVAVKEMEDLWAGTILQLMEPTFMDLGIARELINDYLNNNRMIYLLDEDSYIKEVPIGKSKLGAPLTEIINDRNIESLASNAIIKNRITNLQSMMLHERITKILNLINSELKNK